MSKKEHVLLLGDSLDLYSQAALSSRRTGREIKRDLRRDFAELLDYPVTAITPSMLASVIDKKARTAPTMSARLLGYAKPWFKWLLSRGHIVENPAANLAKPTVEVPRERVLSSDELKAIWQASAEEGYPFGPFVRLLLLTGVRRQELAGCPSSKHLGRLSLYSNGGSGSSRFDVKPLGVDGSSGGSGWSAS